MGGVAVVSGTETLLDGVSPEASEVLVSMVHVEVDVFPLLGRAPAGRHVDAVDELGRLLAENGFAVAHELLRVAVNLRKGSGLERV